MELARDGLPALVSDPVLLSLLSRLDRLERKEVSARLAKVALAAGGAEQTKIAIPAWDRTKISEIPLKYPDQLYGADPFPLEPGKKLDLRVEGDVMALTQQIISLNRELSSKGMKPEEVNAKLMPAVGGGAAGG